MSICPSVIKGVCNKWGFKMKSSKDTTGFDPKPPFHIVAGLGKVNVQTPRHALTQASFAGGFFPFLPSVEYHNDMASLEDPKGPCKCICVSLQIYIYIYTCMHIMCIETSLFICIYTRIHTVLYIYVDTHTHTPVPELPTYSLVVFTP